MIFCSPENVDELKSESSEENISVQMKVFGVKTVFGSTRQFQIWTGPVISYLSSPLSFFFTDLYYGEINICHVQNQT